MYSRLYDPLPDLTMYLERIEAKECKNPDKEYLDRLIYLHQTHIPFENVGVYDRGETVSLATEDMFRKIVTEHRGGFCFELNGLFYHLLRGCDYEVQESKARVVMDKVYGGHVPPMNHRIEIVRIDDKRYFCDVGFGGPSPCAALLIEDGYEETIGGWRFRVEKTDEYWWTQGVYTKAGYEPLIQFTLMPQDLVEYAPLAGYYSTSPLSKFVANRVVNLKTEKGHKAIFNDCYTCVEDGVKTEVEIKDDRELLRILREEFELAY